MSKRVLFAIVVLSLAAYVSMVAYMLTPVDKSRELYFRDFEDCVAQMTAIHVKEPRVVCMHIYHGV